MNFPLWCSTTWFSILNTLNHQEFFLYMAHAYLSSVSLPLFILTGSRHHVNDLPNKQSLVIFHLSFFEHNLEDGQSLHLHPPTPPQPLACEIFLILLLPLFRNKKGIFWLPPGWLSRTFLPIVSERPHRGRHHGFKSYLPQCLSVT